MSALEEILQRHPVWRGGALSFWARAFLRNGGANNAYTSNDVTVYQDWVPRSALELMLFLDSDRMAYLLDVVSRRIAKSMDRVLPEVSSGSAMRMPCPSETSRLAASASAEYASASTTRRIRSGGDT